MEYNGRSKNTVHCAKHNCAFICSVILDKFITQLVGELLAFSGTVPESVECSPRSISFRPLLILSFYLFACLLSNLFS